MTNPDYHTIRWAGGKRWLLKHFDEFTPQSYNNYHEPFIGGASVFLHLNPPKHAYLSDSNAELINAYQQIRDNLEKVWSILKTYKNTKEEYYTIRDKANYRVAHKKAARFLYLNRTSFNGIYRVNLKGIYNVPYGFKEYKCLFEYNKLKRLSERLQGTNLIHCDFADCLQNINESDLVYLDPPYTVTHSKNSFIKYNEVLFSWEQQIKLATFITKIREKKAYFILSHAKHRKVISLFGDLGKNVILKRHSAIGGKNAKRELVEEYVFYSKNGGYAGE
jgi:DNA adenine methylase